MAELPIMRKNALGIAYGAYLKGIIVKFEYSELKRTVTLIPEPNDYTDECWPGYVPPSKIELSWDTFVRLQHLERQLTEEGHSELDSIVTWFEYHSAIPLRLKILWTIVDNYRLWRGRIVCKWHAMRQEFIDNVGLVYWYLFERNR